MRIAIVRLSSLGDIIFCMACLQVIRRHLPGSSITWFADSKFADILDHQKDLDRVVKVELKGLKRSFSWEKLKGEYRQIADSGPFDMVIDLHGMLKSALIARRIGKKTAGFARDVAKEPLATFCYDRTFSLPLEMNTVLRYTKLAASALDIIFDERELTEKEPFLFYGEEDLDASRKFFVKEKKNVILVVGSTWESRNYPKEKFAVVAERLGENVLVCHGSKTEYETACWLAERSPNVSILPKLTINQLKAAISQADLVIGGDTGPTHIAWANNVPCVVLFGPTPAHRIYPGAKCRIMKSSSVVREESLDKNDFSIRELREEDVLSHARELLA
ncbi:lipopolysaccharide heptosyltransferase I [Geomonas sp. Red276]